MEEEEEEEEEEEQSSSIQEKEKNQLPQEEEEEEEEEGPSMWEKQKDQEEEDKADKEDPYSNRTCQESSVLSTRAPVIPVNIDVGLNSLTVGDGQDLTQYQQEHNFATTFGPNPPPRQ